MNKTPLTFEHVYEVTTRHDRARADEIDDFASQLQVPLPIGYREYLTAFGKGELCELLRVLAPGEILEKQEWERENQIEGIRCEWWEPGVLTVADMEQSVTFATTAEGDAFVCCPRFGQQLFELPRHDHRIIPIPNGFYGAVADSVRRMQHDFPFFETHRDGHRRYRGFAVRAEHGVDGFIAEARRRWGHRGFQHSRFRAGEAIFMLFFRATESRFTLYLEDLRAEQWRLPEGCFHVAASFDIEFETEITDFVESMRLAGEESWVR